MGKPTGDGEDAGRIGSSGITGDGGITGSSGSSGITGSLLAWGCVLSPELGGVWLEGTGWGSGVGAAGCQGSIWHVPPMSLCQWGSSGPLGQGPLGQGPAGNI